MKASTEKTETEKEDQATVVSGNVLQQVEEFKYCGWYSRVTEGRTKRLAQVPAQET